MNLVEKIKIFVIKKIRIILVKCSKPLSDHYAVFLKKKVKSLDKKI